MEKKVLFLCTGNYYRSRFTEYLFNALAVKYYLDWRAFSRGIAVEKGVTNIGPIFKGVISSLQKRGIQIENNPRYPLPVKHDEFAEANLIIALCQKEHQPYIIERFPQWQDKVVYWHISDTGFMPFDQAFAEMEKQVELLIQKLVEK